MSSCVSVLAIICLWLVKTTSLPKLYLIEMLIFSKLFISHLSRRIVRIESTGKGAAMEKMSSDWLEKD